MQGLELRTGWWCASLPHALLTSPAFRALRGQQLPEVQVQGLSDVQNFERVAPHMVSTASTSKASTNAAPPATSQSTTSCATTATSASKSSCTAATPATLAELATLASSSTHAFIPASTSATCTKPAEKG